MPPTGYVSGIIKGSSNFKNCRSCKKPIKYDMAVTAVFFVNGYAIYHTKCFIEQCKK